jgi:uncharacterized LabA/DUF88 family protein
MRKTANNYAFIDSQNLNLGVKDCGWKLDFSKFLVYLRDKYSVTKAYLFIGYVSENKILYESLQKMGYICIFKPTLKIKNVRIKGNVDAELVLHSMIQLKNFDKSVIVSGDGDFYCLIKYLIQKEKLEMILIPNEYKYSTLLKGISTPDKNMFEFINRKKKKLEFLKKGK